MMGQFVRLGVCLTCLTSCLYTIYVLAKLTYFLSSHGYEEDENVNYAPSGLCNSAFSTTSWKVATNLYSLNLFLIQHSIMASDPVKEMYRMFNLKPIERSIYNFSSAAVLDMLIMQKWERIIWITMWNYDTSKNNRKIWLAVTALHVIAWFILFCECFVMGLKKFAGAQQISQKMPQKWAPLLKKPSGFTQRAKFVAHPCLIHPSFKCFLVILWFHPVMSLDRLIMALFLTTYMIIIWSIDRNDFCSNLKQVRKKQRHL